MESRCSDLLMPRSNSIALLPHGHRAMRYSRNGERNCVQMRVLLSGWVGIA